jgi:hypothetical protein
MSAPEEREPNDDAGQAVKAAAILGAVLSLATLHLYGTRAAFSVLVGAAMGVGNLVAMRTILRNVLRGSGSAAWALFAGLKIVLLFGGLWFVLTRRLVDPMPLVVGYMVMPLGIVGSAIWSALRSRY